MPLILSWAQTTLARKITIRAPIGYKFGQQVGDPCGIQFHSLHPHMESCKVTDPLNTVELDFAIPLPPAKSGGAQSGPAKGRYELSLYVYTPECHPMERWVADPIRHAIICNEQPDRTRWVIEFLQSPGDAGAEIKDALGFLMEYREGSGIQLPQDLKMKAEQMLLDDAPPTKEVTNSTPAPDVRKQNGWVLCMGVNDIGFCEDRSGRSDVICGWQDVCEVNLEDK